MPNLVGTGLNQVPTNSMLGGLAYQSPDHASIKDLDLKNLSQINASTADTAVDVFVYDTSRDSDGGAWRKRTQHTSWYNETLNTATRGSRREFPAVAVIVAESDTITIYDGDDPDLPMWMVFESGSTIIKGSASNRSISALNGILMLGMNGGTSATAVLVECYFVSDELRQRYDNNYDYQNNNISERNETPSKYLATGDVLVSRYVNDVAMTVLPNAPIDSATGLPVPTIAVATNGGVSVIKDDGTIVDWTETLGPSSTHKLSFRKDGKLGVFTSGTSGAGGYPQPYYIDIPSSDISSLFYYDFTSNNFERYGGTAWETNSANILVLRNVVGANPLTANLTDLVDTSNLTYIATNAGLNAIIRPESFSAGKADMRTAAVAYIQNDYNTGYMVGDIKGAFLSDTDATNVTGETIDLTNGSPQVGDEGNFSSITDNQLVAGTTSDTIGRYNTGTTLETGKQYYATLTISNYSGSGDLGVASGGGFDSTFRYSANGTYTRYITGSDAPEIQIFYRSTNTATIGLSIREVDPDRSVNGKGLQVFGTINKSAVATGAELVAYSGFNGSSGDYLYQPYNSDLNFGTGDFSISVWFKFSSSTSDQYIVDRSADGSPRFLLLVRSSLYSAPNNPQFYTADSSGNTSSLIATDFTVTNDVWTHAVAVRSGGTMYLYINGVKSSVTAGTARDISSVDSSPLYIGTRYSTSTSVNGSISLVRISGSAPSAEQVKKMYEDEKVLFQENAACTLYGSSDAVTALAYDEVTERLHVGTSSGRSEFQGLRRINNTTTAVTTAISAYDSFVVEQ